MNNIIINLYLDENDIKFEIDIILYRMSYAGWTEKDWESYVCLKYLLKDEK